jgi:hypothetical protein
MPLMSRCDLHVHSSYSNRPSEWVLRKLGVPESCTHPEVLYDKLIAHGFDFVTVTDNNRIDGCLDLAGKPNVFISERLTTYFPEDGCKIYVLVWNISEKQHTNLEQARRNIYDLVAYLRDEGIVHGVAHPLFNINQRLRSWHFERMLLLFRVFETTSTLTDPLTRDVLNAVLMSLSQGKIEELANRHNLEPSHKEPWLKSCIGGSDDRCGAYLGAASTVTPAAASVEEYLRMISEGRCRADGDAGSALRLSNSMFQIILNFAKHKLGSTAPYGSELLGKVVERFSSWREPDGFFHRRTHGPCGGGCSDRESDRLHPPGGSFAKPSGGHVLSR